MSNEKFDSLRDLQSRFIPYVIGALAAVLAVFGVTEGVIAAITGVLTVLNGIFGEWISHKRRVYMQEAVDDQ